MFGYGVRDGRERRDYRAAGLLGTRSPMGDAGRIKRWLATGEPGSVAKAAKRYEQEKNAALGGPNGQ